jgi:hypothetical protein
MATRSSEGRSRDTARPGGRDRDAAIARGYRSGSTLSALASEHGVTAEAVRQILVRRGVERRGTADLIHAEYARFAAEHSAALNRVFDRTHSIEAVADQFPDHPRSWVLRVLAPRKAEQPVKLRPNAWTDEELITNLRRAVTEGADSMATYDAWRTNARRAKGVRIPPPVMTFVRRFGSWNEAMARVDPKHAPSRARFTRWSAEESFASYAEYATETRQRNERPTLEAYGEWARLRPGRPTAAAVKYYNLRVQPLPGAVVATPAKGVSRKAPAKGVAAKKAPAKAVAAKKAPANAVAAKKARAKKAPAPQISEPRASAKNASSAKPRATITKMSAKTSTTKAPRTKAVAKAPAKKSATKKTTATPARPARGRRA